ncbi:LysM peptidoglycan-binding domain-containing protein [Croceitalea sp. MTPC9]|uniref:PBP1 and LysM peptidoglycan-binding domain-containing protein n=1 Tax=unclassified Croceitalea TaxID=2632280 RepID=UPI002B3B96B5|nr:LysM peptidoglycan-binding domain-containing protein [Croceitalea sp. MTPC6]GMN15169.1 LysM peptidoglycan-binding domain-containing protein [Croceitalea sp. MTPC9]
MKRLVFKTLGLLTIIFLMSCKVTAQQKYVTHNVKKGETLTSIAKQYRVTPYSILQLNKELKNSDDIKPNTILVIQVDGKTVVEKEEPEEKTKIEQEAPIGYKRHRVRKRETMFGLTQRYGVTEEQIKKYNTDLYSQPLQKGMVLQIPEYPEVEEEEELEVEVYTVKAKETRWSIANKYGITVDSLEVLNPELPKNTSYLAVGQELKLPRPKGDSLDEQETVIFESYTVPKSIGIFRISQNYGIPIDSVIKLNPEINEVGGLKEGMVLRLPKQKPATEIVNTDNYIFYEVKPKQNIFRLTQNLQISRDSLFALNPELENGLKAGMVLKLPRIKEKQLAVKNALVLDNINLIDSINIDNRPNLIFLLPFRLDRVDFNDRKKTKSQVTGRRDMSAALGLYTGALVALDSVKKMGLSVNVKALDTELSFEKTKSILQQQSLVNVDAIVGPLSPNLLGEVAVQASNYSVPVIAPYASKSELSLNNVFFSMPSDETLRGRILDYVAEKKTKEKILVIADDEHQAAKDSILSKFPTARVAKMSKDGSLHLEDFLLMLSENQEYWVFVESKTPNLIASISSILNAANSEENYTVRMFTTNYNSAFDGDEISMPHLSNLKFTYPSAYRETFGDSFSEAYSKKFGNEPDRYATRGFDLTFDILLKLAYEKNLEATSQLIGLTEYSGNKFNYYNEWTKGYFNTASYLMQYDKLQVKQIKE